MTTARPLDLPEAEVPVASPPRRTLRPTKATWPLWAITAGMPLAFLLGVHGVVWPITAVVLSARILLHRETRFPWTTVPLVLFICWIPLSFSVLSLDALPIFAYRFSLFLGCLAAVVWVANLREDQLPTSQIVDWLAALWITTIA